MTTGILETKKNAIVGTEAWNDIIHNMKLSFGYYPRLFSLCYRFASKAESLSYGRNRAVFVFKTYVIKLPMNSDGCIDNDWEGSLSNGENPFIVYARTRMIMLDDIPVILMERVHDGGYDSIRKKLGYLPEWVDCVDCGQAGFNKKGQLVAYDYGYR